MTLKKPFAVRFQVSVRARLPKDALALLRKEVITEAVERWLDSGQQPDNFQIRLTIWTHGKGRAVEIQDDEKGERLRATLRRALKSGKLQIRQVGTTR